MLGGLLAGVAALTVPRANAVDIRDDTKVRERGFDLIYEARDLDLAQVYALNSCFGCVIGPCRGWGPNLCFRRLQPCTPSGTPYARKSYKGSTGALE